MQVKASLFSNRFTRMEIIFFLCYFFLFSLFSDIEFNLREPGGNAVGVFKSIPYRTISGLLYLLPYLLYYKLILQKYLFKERYALFFIFLAFFLFIFNIYTPLINWLIAGLNFPGFILHSAQGINFQKTVTLNFSVMYIFRELIVITALGYFIRSARQEHLIQSMKQQQLHAELNYLKVQLQPHFFFNTLNNIYSLCLQGSERAAPLVAKHAEMMRYILYDAVNNKVNLSQEIAFLRNYTEVESARYSDRINILFESQIVNSRARIEPLLLLPFIENTFKHGIREEVNEGYINIIISLVDNELSVEINNSKVQGRKLMPEKKGIGLENATKRLAILYPQKHTIEINEDDKGYEVRLNISLES